MISPDLTRKMQEAGPPKGRKWLILCAVLILLGAAAFVAGISGSRPERAWEAYLINFVFWIGIAFGGVMFSAVLTITDARWGRPMKRLAESFEAFLPVACVLFWVLYFGREHIFDWIHNPVPEKASWLNVGFLFIRDGAALILLTAVGMAIVYHSVRMDSFGPAGGDREEAAVKRVENTSTRAQKILSPIYGILYAFVLTLIAFDLIMSLEPHWYSTLFGAWYFMGCFYTGLAAVILLMVYGSRVMGLGPFVRPVQFLSIGQLLLGFCLITGDFFFTQILIIWYANMPEETGYVLTRMREHPWSVLAWVVLFSCYIVPFGVLLSRRIKMRIVPMVLLSVLILTGVWLERMLLVAPALWKEGTLPLGVQEILITAGFAGLVFLCVHLFLRRFPALPLRDPMFLEMIRETENEK